MKKAMINTVLGAMAGTMALGLSVTAFASEITIDDAKNMALEAAGYKEEDVIFKQVNKDLDDGRRIFEVDFFVPGEVKFEFDLDAETGMILDEDQDLWEPEDDLEYAPLIADAKKSAEEKVKEAAAAGEITDAQAQEIALKDAGLKADEVTVTKCVKEMDDGVLKFDVEMRTADGTEYSFDIRVSDGTIIDRDVDFD